MILAVVLLLLGLAGVIPIVVAAPLAAGSLVVGAVAGMWIQRTVSSIPPVVGGEAMVGQRAVAVTAVSRDGLITYGNELWRAQTAAGEIGAGTAVRIVELRGLTARIEPIESDRGGQNTGHTF